MSGVRVQPEGLLELDEHPDSVETVIDPSGQAVMLSIGATAGIGDLLLLALLYEDRLVNGSGRACCLTALKSIVDASALSGELHT